MKRFFIILVVLAFLLCTAGCTPSQKVLYSYYVSDYTDTVAKPDTNNQPNSSTSKPQNSNPSSSEVSSDTSNNISEVIDTLESEGYEFIESENENGDKVIDMVTPEDNQNTLPESNPESNQTLDVPTPTPPSIDDIVLPDKENTNPDEEGNGPSTPSDSEFKDPNSYTYSKNQIHTPLPKEERYIYSILNDRQKLWYKKIDTAVTNLQSYVKLDIEVTQNENYYIYFLYMIDNPEKFYMSNQVTVFTVGQQYGGFFLAYSDGVDSDCGDDSFSNIKPELINSITQKRANFEKRVNDIISTVPQDAPDVVKEKLIYDRILMDAHYEQTAVWDGHAADAWTSYGVLLNNAGVCESYSEAFQTLCFAVGINCTTINGVVGVTGHKWCAVELDGEWYACDITFDDAIGGIEGVANWHNFFNITTAQMESADHITADNFATIPNCTGTKYSYTNYFEN